MRKEKTFRGFAFTKFTDRYGDICSLQKSSLAGEDCIWFGIDKVKPIIMAKDTPEGGVGWVDYYVPDNVQLHSRMHLTRGMVAKLLPTLIKFVITGDI